MQSKRLAVDSFNRNYKFLITLGTFEVSLGVKILCSDSPEQRKSPMDTFPESQTLQASTEYLNSALYIGLQHVVSLKSYETNLLSALQVNTMKYVLLALLLRLLDL